MKQHSGQAASRQVIEAFEDFKGLIHKRQSELEPFLSPKNALARMYGLGSGARPVGLLGSVASQPARKTSVSIETLSKELKQHVAYRRLMQSENYVRALRIFQERRASEPDPAQAAIDELRFMEHVLDWVGFSLHIAATGWRPKSVSVQQKRRALLHATQLLSDIKGGVRLKDWTANSHLEQMLVSFCQELNAPARRDYAGHGRERTILTSLASFLAGQRQAATRCCG
jgi:hypothetical protein